MSFVFPKNQNKITKTSQTNKNIFSKNKQLFTVAGFTAIFVMSGSATLFLISSSTLSFFYSRNDASYPTSLPWVESKSQCEQFGRVWRNDQCWDEEHSHTF